MKTIRELDFIPDLPYTQYSRIELGWARQKLLEIQRQSEKIFVVGEPDQAIVVAGVIRPTLLSTPWLWVLICEGTIQRVGALREMRILTQELFHRYPRIETYVEKDWDIGRRFARFCGFSDTERLTKIADVEYNVMEH